MTIELISSKRSFHRYIHIRFPLSLVFADLRLTAYSSDGQDVTDWLTVENWQGSPYCGPSKAGDLAAEKTIEKPEAYGLEEAFPNPFNAMTVIGYNLPESGHVRLSVYDAVGREVDRLVDGFQSAGSFQVRFDASSLPSGVYTYRLESTGHTESQHVVLMK